MTYVTIIALPEYSQMSLEINAQRQQIKDLTERTIALRGYL